MSLCACCLGTAFISDHFPDVESDEERIAPGVSLFLAHVPLAKFLPFSLGLGSSSVYPEGFD